MKTPGFFSQQPVRLSLLLGFFISQTMLPIHTFGHGADSQAAADLTAAEATPFVLPKKPGIQSLTAVGQVYGAAGSYFEPNYGQSASQVVFSSRRNGYTLFLTPTAAVLSLTRGDGPKDPLMRLSGNAPSRRQRPVMAADDMVAPGYDSTGRTKAAVRMQMLGANPSPLIEGVGQLSGISNYFIGSDPRQWRTAIPHYAGVQYREVYPGVDLVYHDREGGLEFDFILAPGAGPEAIKLNFEGAQEISLNSQGDLVLTTDAGEVRQHKPIVYQEMGAGRKEVAGRFVRTNARGVGFEVGEYDRSRPLVIDPKLSFATYLGPSSESAKSSIAVDASGNVYVAGETDSDAFPATAGGGQDSGFLTNAFVAKLDATGTKLIYATILGGMRGASGATGIAVDASGNAYVAGGTDADDFPTTAQAFQSEYAGPRFFPLSPNGDGFVTKLSASGSNLIYSTYLGGKSFDSAESIAIDSSGNAYVTGWTNSNDFPATPGVFGQHFSGSLDTFITKLNTLGSELVYSTSAGLGSAIGSDIAVDSSGNAYVAGSSFPVDVFNAQVPFVIKLNPSATTVLYSVFPTRVAVQLIGPVTTAIAIDPAGNAYVTGAIASPGFPVTAGAFQTAFAGGSRDAFVMKLSDTGDILYSTYLGGKGTDIPSDIAVDTSGNAYVIGTTDSEDFPTRLPLQAINGGYFFSDSFITKINTTGTAILYSTYLGGRGDDMGAAITTDASGNAYAAGVFGSPGLPVTAGAYQAAKQSDFDNFIVKIEPTAETGGFQIINVSVVLDTLLVVGEGFDSGAAILLGGKEQGTSHKRSDPTVLLSKRAAKKIRPGQQVTIQVRNSDGRLTDAFLFTRSAP